MQSKLAEAIGLASSPIAVVLADEKPQGAVQFKEGGWGCVAASISRGITLVLSSPSSFQPSSNFSVPSSKLFNLRSIQMGV